MDYAPVLIITLNRYEHLKRCVDSLRKNRLAEETDLYIGLDYPPSEKYEEGYQKVKKYLESGIRGFHRVIILQQDENKGPFLNFVELQKMAYREHDCFIYSEDDNEFSENYLEYMNKCLWKFKDNDEILAVSGYSYPISKQKLTGNIFSCNTYFSALGYGMWRDKETQMRKCMDIAYFKTLYYDTRYMKKLRKNSRNQFVNMVKGMLEYTQDLISDGKLREVDLAFGLYMFANNMKMVFPIISKVRNWGYDGTGANCTKIEFSENKECNHRNFRFELQQLDEEKEFAGIEEEQENESEIHLLLEKYFLISDKEYRRALIAYRISKICGLKRTRQLLRKMGI